MCRISTAAYCPNNKNLSLKENLHSIKFEYTYCRFGISVSVRNVTVKFYLAKVMICGGTQNKDTCKGDSGGPLVANIDGKFTLVGVTSWGIPCGTVNTHGVYTDISNPSMMKFINQVN